MLYIHVGQGLGRAHFAGPVLGNGPGPAILWKI